MKNRIIDKNIEKTGFFVYFYYNDKTYYLSKSEDTYYFSNNIDFAFIYKDLVNLSTDYRIIVDTCDGLFVPEIWEKFLSASVGKIEITYNSSVEAVLNAHKFLMDYVEKHPFS